MKTETIETQKIPTRVFAENLEKAIKCLIKSFKEEEGEEKKPKIRRSFSEDDSEEFEGGYYNKKSDESKYLFLLSRISKKHNISALRVDQVHKCRPKFEPDLLERINQNNENFDASIREMSNLFPLKTFEKLMDYTNNLILVAEKNSVSALFLDRIFRGLGEEDRIISKEIGRIKLEKEELRREEKKGKNFATPKPKVQAISSPLADKVLGSYFSQIN